MINEKAKEMESADESAYRKLNLSPEKIKEISVTPIVLDGKLLFDKNIESHRYFIEDDDARKNLIKEASRTTNEQYGEAFKMLSEWDKMK